MKLKQLLNSDDIEMVQLGVVIVQERYPKRKWLYKIREMAPTLCTPINPIFGNPYYINKDMEVTEDAFDIRIQDLWAMKQKTTMPLLNMNINNQKVTYVDSEEGKFKFTIPCPQNVEESGCGDVTTRFTVSGTERIPYIVGLSDDA